MKTLENFTQCIRPPPEKSLVLLIRHRHNPVYTANWIPSSVFFFGLFFWFLLQIVRKSHLGFFLGNLTDSEAKSRQHLRASLEERNSSQNFKVILRIIFSGTFDATHVCASIDLCHIFNLLYDYITSTLPLYSTNRHLHLRLVRIMKPHSCFWIELFFCSTCTLPFR